MATARKKIFIKPGGVVSTVYDDATAGPLAKLGKSNVTRASHVEPDPESPGTWYVDLAPSGGPRKTGFYSRQAALDFEVAWLNAHRVPTDMKSIADDRTEPDRAGQQ